jgi:hypothetical protein
MIEYMVICICGRMRKDELSKECENEYREGMVVNLCVGNVGDGKDGRGEVSQFLCDLACKGRRFVFDVL